MLQSQKETIECESCNKDFESKVYVDKKCPYCGSKFEWNSYGTEANNDFYYFADWYRTIVAEVCKVTQVRIT